MASVFRPLVEDLTRGGVKDAAKIAEEVGEDAAKNKDIVRDMLPSSTGGSRVDAAAETAKLTPHTPAPIAPINVGKDAGGNWKANLAKYAGGGAATVGIPTITGAIVIPQYLNKGAEAVKDLGQGLGKGVEKAIEEMGSAMHAAEANIHMPSMSPGGLALGSATAVLGVGLAAFVMYEIFSR